MEEASDLLSRLRMASNRLSRLQEAGDRLSQSIWMAGCLISHLRVLGMAGCPNGRVWCDRSGWEFGFPPLTLVAGNPLNHF